MEKLRRFKSRRVVEEVSEVIKPNQTIRVRRGHIEKGYVVVAFAGLVGVIFAAKSIIDRISKRE